MDRIPDPYRELGVLRGATDAQVKAAHRRLAKRFHPDAPEGDTDRFLAIQEAYSLLSDPLRRRDWDATHASGPVRAGDPGRPRGGRRVGRRRAARVPGGAPRRIRASGGASGSGSGPVRDGGVRGVPPGRRWRRRGRVGRGSGRESPERGRPVAGRAADDRTRPGRPATRSIAGGRGARPTATRPARSTTWSAAGVPWWEDFSPRDRGAGTARVRAPRAAAGGARAAWTAAGASRRCGERRRGEGRSGRPAGDAGGAGAEPTRRAAPAEHGTARARHPVAGRDLDVYSRSSGAAWSMAARRYFRKGEAELPKGGAWRYRGTQVVTGAEARKVAAEEEARAAAVDGPAEARAGSVRARTASAASACRRGSRVGRA